MTQKEKAKAYDEALERAREIKSKILSSHLSTESYKAVSEYIDTIIPELAESEDERIGNVIYCIVRDNKEVKRILEGNSVSVDNALTYLENQKEQKSLNISAASEWLKERVHRYMNSEYNEFHKCIEYDGSIDKERLINDFEEAMRKEQKPTEWSEEDENMLKDCSSAITSPDYYFSYDERCAMDDWLQSLRPHSHWKPSEEQMEALKEASASWMNQEMGNCELLESLYNDLKKLM